MIWKPKEQIALALEVGKLAKRLNERLERVESAGLQDTLAAYKGVTDLFEMIPNSRSSKPVNDDIIHVENRFRGSWKKVDVDTLLDAKRKMQTIIGLTNVSLGSDEVLKEATEVRKIFTKSLKLEMPLPENATDAERSKRNRLINKITNDFLESKRVIPQDVMNSEQRIIAIKEIALRGIDKTLEEVFDEYVSENKGDQFMFNKFLYFIKSYMGENRLFGTTIKDGNWTPTQPVNREYKPYIPLDDLDEDEMDYDQFKF